MSRPNARQSAALSAALSGAVDLSALKARAEAAARPKPASPPNGAAAPAAGGQFALDVSEADFQAVVERSLDIPVIISLWADWSPESSRLTADLERLAGTANGAWILAKVDVEANPRIAQLFGVQSVPTTVAVAGGQPVDAFAGALPLPEVQQWISSLLDALRDKLPGIAAAEAGAGAATVVEEEPEDLRFNAAEDAFDLGDFAAAEAAYQRILDEEPANELAKAGLTQARFALRAQTTDADTVSKADSDPADIDLQLAAADQEISVQQVDEAFTRLISAVRRTRDEDRNKVREHLVSLFDLFPPDDPRVMAARRNLASALF
ncbi:co-chaperone YbbN [Pseudonocardiaceae bacterium YIM PH 21723]|nr:co-chaperone YbbN [Pseudonocardiaceae bacterium YIM PH 21723]